jgi:hypothetical protein
MERRPTFQNVAQVIIITTREKNYKFFELSLLTLIIILRRWYCHCKFYTEFDVKKVPDLSKDFGTSYTSAIC